MNKSFSNKTDGLPDVEPKPASTPAENCAACVGANGTETAKPSITSEPEVGGKEQNSSKSSAKHGDEMTRSQALAVAWTGIEALARMPYKKGKGECDRRHVILLNSSSGILWVGIQGARVNESGRLIDALAEDE